MTVPALRAAARIAWRQARRAPGRSALVVAMIAMPIAALTLGVTLIRTSVPTLEEYVTRSMGSAELRVDASTDVDPHTLEAVLPEGSRVVVIRQWNRTLVVNGTLVWASVFEPSIPIDRPPIPGLYELIDGRAPTKPGEAAVDPRVLEIFDVRIGDELTIGERSFHIVGVAVRPEQMWDPLVVAAPGTLGASTVEGEDMFGSGILVDLPRGADVEATKRALEVRLRDLAQAQAPPERRTEGEYVGESISTRERAAQTRIDDAPRLSGVSFAGAVVVLFGTGLIVAAAFAVGIRRQLRMLGLIGATGGEPLHVRAVVLLGGTSLGLLGSVLGIAVGIAGAYALTPQLPRLTHAWPGSVLLDWPMLIGAAALGTLAATAAAAWPARLAVRISTIDALAARMPSPRPTGRLARRGLIGAGIGAVMVAVTARRGGNTTALTAGLVLMLGGFLVTVPLLLQIAGRLAPRLPTAPRLAVRETARYGRRAGVAIAATALALMLPVSVAALSLSEEGFQRRIQTIGPEHVLVGSTKGGDVVGQPVRLPDPVLTEIRRALPGATAPSYRGAKLDLERYPPPSDYPEPIKTWTATVEGPPVHLEGDASAIYRESGQLYIGGPDLLRALNAEGGIPVLQAGKVVGIGPGTVDRGVVHLLLVPSANQWAGTATELESEQPRVELPAVEAGRVRYGNDILPRYVVSPEAASSLGLLPGQSEYTFPYSGALIAARAPLTSGQIRSVKQIAARYPDTYVTTVDDFLPDFGPARLAATGAAVLIGLAIVAVTVSLVGAEARRDQAILVAVGATPGARRRIAAARAGSVALLAGVIAVPAGFAPVALIQWSRVTSVLNWPKSFPVVVPWSTMALVGLAVPLIAGLFGGLASRAPKASALLQPIH